MVLRFLVNIALVAMALALTWVPVLYLIDTVAMYRMGGAL